jgi:hypothetical protein
MFYNFFLGQGGATGGQTGSMLRRRQISKPQSDRASNNGSIK